MQTKALPKLNAVVQKSVLARSNWVTTGKLTYFGLESFFESFCIYISE